VTNDRDVDVLVLGSGAAGLTAALSARQDAAASVLIAEAEGLVGGSSRLSGGLTMGAGTRYQRALGIADGADALFYDYMTLNHWGSGSTGSWSRTARCSAWPWGRHDHGWRGGAGHRRFRQ